MHFVHKYSSSHNNVPDSAVIHLRGRRHRTADRNKIKIGKVIKYMRDKKDKNSKNNVACTKNVKMYAISVNYVQCMYIYRVYCILFL